VYLFRKYFCHGVPPVGLLLSTSGPTRRSPVSTWCHVPHHSLLGRGSAAMRPRHKGADRLCLGRQRWSEAAATLPAPDRPCPKPVAAQPHSAPPPGKRVVPSSFIVSISISRHPFPTQVDAWPCPPLRQVSALRHRPSPCRLPSHAICSPRRSPPSHAV
jgi:hypothetical protein